MDATKTGAAAATNINTFEPPSDFVQEGDCDTLLLYLPGFVKEQLRVQLARSGVLKISGTRPLGDNKWSSFQKEFPVSANCDTSRITAKFEEGILYVRQPKTIVPAVDEQSPAGPAKTANNNNNNNNNNNREKTADAAPKITTPPADHKEANKDEKKSSEPRSEVTDKVDERNHHNAPDVKTRQPSDELKVARQKMTVVLVAVLAFVLGMWIKNMQGWFSGGIPADE